MEKENWKKLKKHPDHEISDLGIIRRIKDGKVYPVNKNKDGVAFSIIRIGDNTRKTVMIARTVLILFKGAKAPKIEYIDGNKLNCRLSNLKYSSFNRSITVKQDRHNFTCLDCSRYPCIYGRTSEYVQPTHYAKLGCFNFKLKK